ncbi:MAG: HTTM domain-containing protein [Myxococcota bacterium]
MTTASERPAEDPDKLLSPFSREFWLGHTDLRPVAIFRILLGLITVHDILRRFQYLEEWHTDNGVLPRMALVEGIARPWRFSLLDTMGTTPMVAVFFVVGLIAAVCLTIGFHTRLATFVAWIFVVSVQERNLGVTDSSDTLFRVMLFWLMFAPAGAAYSIDRALDPASDKPWPPRGSAVALRIMQAELILLYFITSVAKSGDHWRDGSAIYRTLQVYDFARPTGEFFVKYLGALSRPMSWGSLALEFSICCLLWVPKLQVRKLLLLFAAMFHLGIEFFMNVGMFSFMMPMTYAVFLWPSACDWLEKRAPRFRGLVAWFESTGKTYLPDPPSSHVDWVGTWKNKLALGVCGTLFGIILAEQPHELNNRLPRTPMPMWATMETLSLWQNWRMFAPNPVFDSGPWTGEGTLTDGTTKVDVLSFGAPGLANPPEGRWWYERWQKYRLHIRTPEQRGYLLWLGKYLCRRYNNTRRPGEALLDNFELIYHLKKSHGPDEPENPVVPTVMWKHYCIKVPDEKK